MLTGSLDKERAELAGHFDRRYPITTWRAPKQLFREECTTDHGGYSCGKFQVKFNHLFGQSDHIGARRSQPRRINAHELFPSRQTARRE
jgi:hypothetical protein